MTNISQYVDLCFPQFEPELKVNIAECAKLKSIPEGEEIIQTGQGMHSAILLAAGRLKFYRQTESGNELLIYDLEAGDACAMSMALTPGTQTSKTRAVASDDSLVILISAFYTRTWMEKYRSWNIFVVDTFRKRFEEMVTAIDQIAFKNMDERLVDYLQDQQKKKGSNRIFLTHRQIANDLNSSREVISRLLKKLENGQKLKLFRNHLELLAPMAIP